MKRKIYTIIITALLASTIFASCLTPNLPRASSEFFNISMLLTQLETSVLYSYQTPQWRSRRSGWIRDVNNVSSLGRMQELLIEFETNVNYSAQVNTWPSRRPGWMNDVRNANTIGGLVRLMVECETSITYNAQVQSWSRDRANWLALAGLYTNTSMPVQNTAINSGTSIRVQEDKGVKAQKLTINSPVKAGNPYPAIMLCTKLPAGGIDTVTGYFFWNDEGPFEYPVAKMGDSAKSQKHATPLRLEFMLFTGNPNTYTISGYITYREKSTGKLGQTGKVSAGAVKVE